MSGKWFRSGRDIHNGVTNQWVAGILSSESSVAGDVSIICGTGWRRDCWLYGQYSHPICIASYCIAWRMTWPIRLVLRSI